MRVEQYNMTWILRFSSTQMLLSQSASTIHKWYLHQSCNAWCAVFPVFWHSKQLRGARSTSESELIAASTALFRRSADRVGHADISVWIQTRRLLKQGNAKRYSKARRSNIPSSLAVVDVNSQGEGSFWVGTDWGTRSRSQSWILWRSCATCESFDKDLVFTVGDEGLMQLRAQAFDAS